MSTIQRAVGAVVFDDEGRVLLVRRGKPPYLGSWTLPGGRIEPGETAPAAVEREVLEETGLAVQARELVANVVVAEEGFSYAIDDYLCIIAPSRLTETRADSSREICAGDDALEVRWARTDELETLGVRAPAVLVIEKAARLATG